MSDLKPGDWIAGEYRVRRVFGGTGKSGMGVVYLVEGRTSEEPFVLKTFQASEKSGDLIRRFENEAEVWVSLGKHANLVECFWVRKYADRLFVAAEYIWPDLSRKNTLTQHIQSGHVPVTKQTMWISQRCFAMRHAIKNGLVSHRDIKPDNMMIDGAGNLKLTDFGLARMPNNATPRDVGQGKKVHSPSNGFTIAGTVLGTPPFMAPDQFLDSSSTDHRSDIYSLGVVAFMLAADGQIPIRPADASGSLASWAVAHLQKRVPMPARRWLLLSLDALRKIPPDDSNPSTNYWRRFPRCAESIEFECPKRSTWTIRRFQPIGPRLWRLQARRSIRPPSNFSGR